MGIGITLYPKSLISKEFKINSQIKMIGYKYGTERCHTIPEHIQYLVRQL